MGAVGARPMMTDTRMPMGSGRSSVERLMTSPSPLISDEMAGPARVAMTPPAMMVTAGTSTMSTGVLPAISEPISAPATAAR